MLKTLSFEKREKITSGTKEWADHNVNCIKGCYNDCRYCYAKMMAKRFGRTTEKTWHNMTVRQEAIVKDYRKLSGRVMFPSSHDIFDFPQIEKACFTVLAKLLRKKNNVLIATKPRINVIRDIDRLFSEYKEYIQFRFTITSIQDELQTFWEPNAPNLHERMKSLLFAFEEGYKTSVSIEPFLDYDPEELVELVTPFVTESIWVGKMNYIPRNNLSPIEQKYYNDVRKNYRVEHLWEIYFKLKDQKLIKFKDSIRTKLNL